MSTQLGGTARLKEKISLLERLVEKLESLLNKIQKKHIVVIHHSATPRDYTSFEAIDHYHKRVGYPESKLGYHCAYNMLITAEGEIHQARRLDESGEGVSALKELYTGICLTGNFMREQPSTPQKKALKSAISKVKNHFKNRKVVVKPHRSYHATLCPGGNLIDFISEL